MQILVWEFTLSSDSLLLRAVSGSALLEGPSMPFVCSFVDGNLWINLEGVPPENLAASVVWARPIDSNNSLVTAPRFLEGELIFSVDICFERHSDSCSAAANCEFSALYTLDNCVWLSSKYLKSGKKLTKIDGIGKRLNTKGGTEDRHGYNTANLTNSQNSILN